MPRPFVVLGTLWLLVALSLTVAGTLEWRSPGASPDTIVWPGLGILAIVGGIGLITGRSYARGVIGFLAGIGFLGLSAFLISAFYPLHLFWWLPVPVIAFFAWSLFFVIKLWPDYAAPVGAAG